MRTDRVPLLCCVQRTGPGGRRLRRLEAEAGHGRRRVGYPRELAPVDLAAEPHVEVLLELADDGPRHGVHHHLIRGQVLLSDQDVGSRRYLALKLKIALDWL